VVDTGNNRYWSSEIPTTPALPVPTLTRCSSSPALVRREGIYVSPATGEIWVANTSNTGNGTCLGIPASNSISCPALTTSASRIPTVRRWRWCRNQYGDLLVADSANRVEFYYPGLASQNAASFLSQSLAPGGSPPSTPWASHSARNTANSNQQPNPSALPTLLADTQVLFNGQPAPLLLVSPGQINFMIPMSAPTSGTADVQVVRQSTGPDSDRRAGGHELGFLRPSSPGGWSTARWLREVQAGAVVNAADGTVNGPNNPAAGWFVHFHLRHWTGLCAGRSARRRHSAWGAGKHFDSA